MMDRLKNQVSENKITIIGDLNGTVLEFNEFYCTVQMHGSVDSDGNPAVIKYFRKDFKNGNTNEWLWDRFIGHKL